MLKLNISCAQKSSTYFKIKINFESYSFFLIEPSLRISTDIYFDLQ